LDSRAVDIRGDGLLCYCWEVSVLLASAAAVLYAATVVGVHRLGVSRRRARAGGFSSLRRLDWDSLLEGVLPSLDFVRGDAPERLPTGDSTPPLLLRAPVPGAEARHRLFLELVAGAPLPDLDDRAREAGLAGGTLEWIRTLTMVRAHPDEAIERLDRARPTSAPELYLREYLRLVHRTNALNLEVSIFGAKRRLARGLVRFGDRPCLYFVRALASSCVGMNGAAVDDLARAVYFSRQSPFYLRAVVDTAYIEEVRPVLAYQCREALAATEPKVPRAIRAG
jgi:hypothetical protein